MNKRANIIYGVNPVRELLLSGEQLIEKIYLLANRGGAAISEVRSLAREQEITLLITERDKLDRIAGTPKNQGVVAFLSSETTYAELDGLMDHAAQSETPAFLLLVDGVEDPRNLGAIIRTADAAGVNGIVIPSRRAAGLSPVVAKTSAGALAHLPVARATNISTVIDHLKKVGLWIVALDMSGERSYEEHDFTGPIAIVVGGEGKGLRKTVLEKCDHIVSLPMLGHVTSLNVSVAVGILSYEVIRQRKYAKK